MKKAFKWLCIVNLLGGFAYSVSCSPPVCKGNFSEFTLNPNESPCKQECDCNNFLYEGSCVNGMCKARIREDCLNPGEERVCNLLADKRQGACTQGVQICQPPILKEHKKWGDCVAPTPTVKETSPDLCFDGKDNDCDGQIDQLDKDCTCQPGKKGTCYSGPLDRVKGECRFGLSVCTAQGEWGPCQGETTPIKEVCDNQKDDDCDGETDEDCDKEKETTTPDAGEPNVPDMKKFPEKNCECTPGQTRTEDCGSNGCGKTTLTCDSSCKWRAGSCQGDGVCKKGSTKVESCGKYSCRKKTLLCDGSCQWQVKTACAGNDECNPGQTKPGSCGSNGCGKTTLTCDSSCKWRASSCQGDGVCKKGSTKSCGEKLCEKGGQIVCNDKCQWIEQCDRNTYGWVEFVGHGRCMRLIASSKNHADAKANCAAHGGDLVNLCNDIERKWVHSTFSKGSFYFLVGGFGSAGKWTWQGQVSCPGVGIPSVFWNPGEPSGDGSCVELLQNGKLNDIPCTDTRFSVCEVKGKPKKFKVP